MVAAVTSPIYGLLQIFVHFFLEMECVQGNKSGLILSVSQSGLPNLLVAILSEAEIFDFCVSQSVKLS